MNNWTCLIDSLWNKIRLNCIQLTNTVHIKNHLYYKGASAYFKGATIVLSAGSDAFMGQETMSVIKCSFSMVITILISIKLYMKITENSSQDQELAIVLKLSF